MYFDLPTYIFFQVCRAACPTSYYVYIETKAKALGTLTQSDVDKMICKDWATTQPSTSSSSVGSQHLNIIVKKY